ncbi:MAG: polyprenyl synthetase family protein [Bacteroidales bacterium]|jgi:octaprenyl-diphosphate synthase|nr:polyprenyl synthetase family protein [Bacteroidales bacterium]
MIGIEKIKQSIVAELETFDRQFKQTLKSDVFLLNLITRYVLKTKGKQIRPILVMLSARLFGEIGPKTYTAASLVELLHTASLVHDDVVDNANERRGAFSVYALWKSKTSVLFGDYLLARGLLVSVDNEAYDLLRIVSVAVKEMCEGELLQLQHSRKQDITQEAYFRIIHKKTAALISACTEAGAQSGGATPKQLEQMRQFGNYLGLIFQIKDDLFDYQPHGITGKPAGNDIKEKKFTLPLIHALQQASHSERKQILKLINSSATDSEKLKTIARFVEEKGGLEHCRTTMNELAQKAIAIIDTFPPSDATAALKETVDYTINRNR